MTPRHQTDPSKRSQEATVFKGLRLPLARFEDLGHMQGFDSGPWLLDEIEEDFDIPGDVPSAPAPGSTYLLKQLARDRNSDAYDPYSGQYGGMFLNLANLTDDERSIQGFARRYGRLGVTESLPCRGHVPSSGV